MKIKKINRKKQEKGFSLIEMLVVMVIIGLLASIVGPKMFSKVGKSKQKSAQAQISMFGTALNLYRLDMGKFPTTDQGLAVLRVKPDDNEKWDGPYLPKEIPLDPWGNAYLYESPSPHGDYQIVSLGADGTEGGEGEDQDIVSWKNLGKE